MGAKSSTKMLADLRTDLKDSGALWSDAELLRDIERAMSDFSRFSPKEMVYEATIDFDVDDEDWTSPATTSLTAVVSAGDINVAAGNYLTVAGQPDVPRVLTLTMTDANNSAYGVTIIVIGTDKDDKAISETFHWSRGMSKTMVGVKEFKKVYTVELDADAGSGVGDTMSVGYGLFTAAWIYLGHTNIKEGSESVKNTAGTTTYARGTDYEIDYANGRIRCIAGGSLVTATAYHISYDLSQIVVDLESVDGLINIDRIEYPVGSIPQKFIGKDLWGKKLFIGADEAASQTGMSEAEHIAVYYTKAYTVPTDYAPSDCPEFLENTIEMAAAAYALFQYALKYEHQSVTDLASARTNADEALTAETAFGQALTNAVKYLNNNTAVDAAGILAVITSQAADLRTAIETALDAAAIHTSVTTATGASLTASGAATTAITNSNVATWLGDVNTALDAVIIVLGLVATNSLDKQTTGAEVLLDTGESKLLTVNLGGEQTNVPEGYRSFAEARVAIANARVSQAIAYVNEAAQRIAGIRSYIDQAETNVNIANSYIAQANACTNGLALFIQEAAQRIDNIRTYIQQATAYIEIANGFIAEAVQRNAVVQSYLQLSDRYQTASNQSMLLADKFRLEATNRRDEVWAIWRDKRQWIGAVTAVSSSRQMQ